MAAATRGDEKDTHTSAIPGDELRASASSSSTVCVVIVENPKPLVSLGSCDVRVRFHIIGDARIKHVGTY